MRCRAKSGSHSQFCLLFFVIASEFVVYVIYQWSATRFDDRYVRLYVSE